jgi:hypothetical protein
MKTSAKLSVGSFLCVSLCSVAFPQATLISDSLLNAQPETVWSTTPPLGAPGAGGGTSEFQPTGLGYRVTTPTADDNAYRTLMTYQGPSTSSWRAAVTVHLGNEIALNIGDYLNLNLIVAKSSNPSFATSLALDRYVLNDGRVVRGIEAYSPVGGNTPFVSRLTNTTDATLRIDFNHAQQSLTYWVDLDGAAGGATFLQVGSVAADISAWNMTADQSFGFVLVGSSGSDDGDLIGPAVLPDYAYFSDFSVTAVPEPSTYALFAGLATLAWAVWRRR